MKKHKKIWHKLQSRIRYRIFKIKYPIERWYIEHCVIPKGAKREPMDLMWGPDYDAGRDVMIPNGVPICPYCHEFPYSYTQCQFCGQRFTEESVKMGNIPEQIEYTSENGYRGVLYGRSSMIIYNPDGKESMHTGSRNIDTLEELKKVVDAHPAFIEMLRDIANNTDDEEIEDDDI